jgi:hypothetical protein
MSEMRKIPRSMMRSWMLRQLQVQGHVCAVCKLPIDTSIKGEGVLDHNHTTGEIRGVLHRSCNAAIGKVDHAVGHWGSKSMDYANIIPYLQKILDYYKQPGCGVMYALHKTADEKADARNLKARQRRAEVKAKLALRGNK